MTGMEKPRDVVGGLLVVAIGAGFFLFGRELEMGTSFRMGPGYFPTILSVLMMLLGAAMVAIAWRKPPTEGAVGSTPEEFAAFMQSESKRWAELIAKTGLTLD